MEYFINIYSNKTNDNDKDLKCNHNNRIYLREKEICKDCGEIINEELNTDTNYVNGEITNENLTSSLLPNMSMNTYISGNRYTSLQKLHLWNKVSSSERSLSEVFKKIDTYMYNIYDKNIIQDTKRVYTELYNNSDGKKILTRGNIRLGLICACVYISLINNNLPHEPFELSKIFDIELKTIKSGIRTFYQLNLNRNSQIYVKDISFVDYFNRFCNLLNMKRKNIEICNIILNRIKKLNLIKNNNTIVIVFGIIYLVIKKLNLKITKNKLLETSNISEITLNKIFKFYDKYSKLLFIDLNY
jgi:transcription initiation factor TFIIIB Brf1 subunit/transcription initiation factor TFIIB